MMQDLFLRTNSEADMKAAVPFLLDEDGNWHHDTLQFSVSVVGAIPAELDGEGEMVKPGDDSFHVNVRLIDPDLLTLVPVEVNLDPLPGTPVRVWS